MERDSKTREITIKDDVAALLCHWTLEPSLLVTITTKIETVKNRAGLNGSDMDSYKIIAVLLLANTIGTVLARPGHGGYLGYSSPISYTTYSYPSYGYGHGLYSSYSYPYYSYGHGYGYGHGYSHGDYGFGGFLGNYW